MKTIIAALALTLLSGSAMAAPVCRPDVLHRMVCTTGQYTVWQHGRCACAPVGALSWHGSSKGGNFSVATVNPTRRTESTRTETVGEPIITPFPALIPTNIVSDVSPEGGGGVVNPTGGGGGGGGGGDNGGSGGDGGHGGCGHGGGGNCGVGLGNGGGNGTGNEGNGKGPKGGPSHDHHPSH